MLRLLLRQPTSPRIASKAVFARPTQYLIPSRQFSTRNTSHNGIGRIGNAYRHFQAAELRRPNVLAAVCVGGVRTFHTTRRNQYGPLVGFLAGVLKTSTALEFARTAVRVALTFIPVILIKNHKSRKYLAVAEAHNHHDLDAQKDIVMKRIRHRTILFHALLFAPILLFWATIVASLERTPLTGRWRLILLSPEEEEDIATQLAGSGWYHAVGEILSKDGPPQLIPPTDWRLYWVQDTLRRLESVIPFLQREQDLEPRWLECGPDDIPFPPPAEFPLRPRPRASEYLRRFAEFTCARTVHPAPHVIPGPPYSLIVVDKPESSNAFSYGFGPDGGGGIVVFSGFLDDVLSKNQLDGGMVKEEVQEVEPFWWNTFFGSLFAISPPAPPSHPVPTEEQTSQLAILLAHELAHLILAHHLETLSSGSIIWPGVMSIATDVVRALLFPVTMLFGPFINDALAGMGKISSGEFSELAEYCTSQSQEIEADIVSARLLAHAGFDPRHAVQFWEGRRETEQNAECSPAVARENYKAKADSHALKWMGSSHPMNVDRVSRLKGELARWEKQRQAEQQSKTSP